MQFTRCKLTTALCSAFPAGTPELWEAASAQLPLHMHSCAMCRASPSSQGRCHDVRKHSLEQQPPWKPLSQEDFFSLLQQALHQMKGAKCLCDSTNLPHLHRTSANYPGSNIRSTRARRQQKSHTEVMPWSLHKLQWEVPVLPMHIHSCSSESKAVPPTLIHHSPAVWIQCLKTAPGCFLEGLPVALQGWQGDPVLLCSLSRGNMLYRPEVVPLGSSR